MMLCNKCINQGKQQQYETPFFLFIPSHICSAIIQPKQDRKFSADFT
jgi:hypothetical protein